MSVNLDKMSLSELKSLRKDVDKAISGYEARKKAEALSALEAKASEMGFSLSELTGGGSKRISAPKYSNPEKPGQTWTGRGRQPAWFKSAIASGKSPDDLRI